MASSTGSSAMISRFTRLCQEDDRIVAGFVCGSYARGAADEYSDLDLGLVTRDDAWDEFTREKADFIRRLGEPLLLEDFDQPDAVFFIMESGIEGELYLAPSSAPTRIYAPVFAPLVDKTGLLQGVSFTGQIPAPAKQRELLRRQVCWFWHDLSHFITAMARRQHWWAYGQLETLRRTCLTLAHLQQDFTTEMDVHDPYYKLEKFLPAEVLAPLQASICRLEPGAMLEAVQVILRYYRAVAPSLAQEHGIAYPSELDRLLTGRLSQIRL